MLLGSSLPIPLVHSQLSLPLFLFGQRIEPLMGSLCPLPKRCLVGPISGRVIQIVQFFFEQPAACSEGVPRLPILPSLLWTSVGLTFFCRYFMLCFLASKASTAASSSSRSDSDRFLMNSFLMAYIINYEQSPL